ncbi:MAG: hypothetical protein K8S56_07145 [Candidatus Cloacimonetes bacterium]|nr:hypothetical protein [Candidatus Cloacimonadota bacterium]
MIALSLLLCSVLFAETSNENVSGKSEFTQSDSLKRQVDEIRKILRNQEERRSRQIPERTFWEMDNIAMLSIAIMTLVVALLAISGTMYVVYWQKKINTKKDEYIDEFIKEFTSNEIVMKRLMKKFLDNEEFIQKLKTKSTDQNEQKTESELSQLSEEQKLRNILARIKEVKPDGE